jgi:hypothetical protein
LYLNLAKAQELVELGKMLPEDRQSYSATLASELLIDALIGMTVISTADFFTGDITSDRVDMVDYAIGSLADSLAVCMRVAAGSGEIGELSKHIKTATTFWLNSKATDRQEILA